MSKKEELIIKKPSSKKPKPPSKKFLYFKLAIFGILSIFFIWILYNAKEFINKGGIGNIKKLELIKAEKGFKTKVEEERVAEEVQMKEIYNNITAKPTGVGSYTSYKNDIAKNIDNNVKQEILEAKKRNDGNEKDEEVKLQPDNIEQNNKKSQIYSSQIITLSSRESATSYLIKLKEKYKKLFDGQNYQIEEIIVNKTQKLYRLKVGKFKNLDDARNFCKKFSELEDVDAGCVVVEY